MSNLQRNYTDKKKADENLSSSFQYDQEQQIKQQKNANHLNCKTGFLS